MKRKLAIFALVAIILAFVPGLPTLANPTRVPHEDPARATEAPDAATLISSYRQIIGMAGDRQFDLAREMLAEARGADIPTEIRDTIDRYGSLYQHLLDTLEKLEPLPGEVSARLDEGDSDQALQLLTDYATDIRDAATLARDIAAVTDTISLQLGGVTETAAEPGQAAIARLQENQAQLDGLLQDLALLQDDLYERYTVTAGLTATELSLGIGPRAAFVGDSVTAAGRLTGGGQPLPGREITLYAVTEPDEHEYTYHIMDIITGDGGYYTTELTLPYIYEDRVNIIAAYQPSAEDGDVYTGSQSPPAGIANGFYETSIVASVPFAAAPGKPFTVSGRVTSDDGATARRVSIILDDAPAAEATVTESFSLEVTPPGEAATDESHVLSIQVAPEGRYSGATENHTINLATLPVYIELQQAPKVAFLPHTARLAGRVYDASGPVAGAPVTIDIEGAVVTTRTDDDGGFTASLRLPFDLPFISGRSLTVTAAPQEPWLESGRSERRLYTINLISLELLALIILAAWILADAFRPVRRREAAAAIPPPTLRELPAVTAVPRPPMPGGIRGNIIAAYRVAVRAVERATGTRLAPSVTLREFQQKAALPAPDASGRFAELTDITETAIYAGSSPRREAAARAEELANAIDEELPHEAS